MRKIVLILALVGAAIAAAGQALPSGSVLFGQNTWLAPDGSVWTGKDGYGYKKLLSPDALIPFFHKDTSAVQFVYSPTTFDNGTQVWILRPPSHDNDATNKKYVDDAIAEIDVGGTDLGITGTTGARTITSSTGTGAVIPLATTSVSGLMSPSDKQTMVTTNTDQTITGAKTFTSTVRVTGVSSFGEGMNLVAGSNGAGGFAVIGGDTTRAAAFNDHGGFYIGYGTGIPGQVNVPIMQIHLPTSETTFNGDVKATEFYRTSTRKIKKDIAPFSESAIPILNGVNVVEYKLKKGPDYKKIGFIAEDTHEYLATPEHNVMDQGSTIGLLIKAVQELSAKVEDLERRLAECQE